MFIGKTAMDGDLDCGMGNVGCNRMNIATLAIRTLRNPDCDSFELPCTVVWFYSKDATHHANENSDKKSSKESEDRCHDEITGPISRIVLRRFPRLSV